MLIIRVISAKYHNLFALEMLFLYFIEDGLGDLFLFWRVREYRTPILGARSQKPNRKYPRSGPKTELTN
jgi:hypothetical protein